MLIDDRHGRDGKLCVWSLAIEDEQSMSTQLPIEEALAHRKQPWLLHTLDIPTMNFCSFASCIVPVDASLPDKDNNIEDRDNPKQSSLLLAVSGTNESQIDLYHLPTEKKVATIPAPEQVNTKTGMVMALKLFHSSSTNTSHDLHVIAGYESGRTYVFKRVLRSQNWETIYTSCPHSQPILSLDVSPTFDCYYTSSADAIIAKHPLLMATMDDKQIKEVQTRHAGQQGLTVRSDGRVLATAGWDSKARVYSAKTMKEFAVLRWHKDGCYAIAFAEVVDTPKKQDIQPRISTSTDVATTEATGQIYKTVEQMRNEKTRTAHWLAVGAKDGKVSLWDIY